MKRTVHIFIIMIAVLCYLPAASLFARDNQADKIITRVKKKYDEIKMPPKPISLAEQLFGGVKQTDDDEEPGQEDDNG